MLKSKISMSVYVVCKTSVGIARADCTASLQKCTKKLKQNKSKKCATKMPHYFSTRLEFCKLSYLDDRRTQDPQKLSRFSAHGKPNLKKKHFPFCCWADLIGQFHDDVGLTTNSRIHFVFAFSSIFIPPSKI